LRVFDDLECYAVQLGRRTGDVGDVFTDKRYDAVFEGMRIVVCWVGGVSGSFRGGRGGGEVVVGTGKGLHVRPSSPGTSRVLIEAAWIVGCWWETYRQANVILRINNWCWIQTTATREDVGRVRRRDSIIVDRQASNSNVNPGQGGKGSPRPRLARSSGPGSAL
jgi:hypothetical protein